MRGNSAIYIYYIYIYIYYSKKPHVNRAHIRSELIDNTIFSEIMCLYFLKCYENKALCNYVGNNLHKNPENKSEHWIKSGSQFLVYSVDTSVFF